MPTDYLKLALDSIPGKAELTAAADGLAARKRELSTPPVAFGSIHALADEVVRAIRSGDPVPDDLGRRAFDAENITAMWGAEKRVLDLASLTLESDQANWLRDGSSAALTRLREHLQPLLDRAREALSGLGGTTSAEEAIDAGPDMATAWSTFTFLAKEYRSLRQAQRQLMLNAVGGSGGMGSFVELDGSKPFGLNNAPLEDLLNRVGEIRNYAEMNPDWVVRRIIQARSRDNAWVEPLAFDFEGDPVTHLRALLADQGAEIWLPSLKEATDAYSEAYRIGKEYQLQAEADDPRRFPMSEMSEGQLNDRLANYRAAHSMNQTQH